MENPYQAPNSRIEVIEDLPTNLASRGSRLGAAFLDGFIMIAVLLPIGFATGLMHQMMENLRTGQTSTFGVMMLWSLIGLVGFVLIQGYPLVKDGQTWGKKMVNIKIVGLDGKKPTVGHLAARYAVYMLLGKIPFVGGIFSLINICFIFRDDKRCIHDLVASTRVIEA